MSNQSTWSEGETVAGEYSVGSDPFVYRYLCRCCGVWYCLMGERTSQEPTLCPVCMEAIHRESIRRLASLWLDSIE